MSAATATVEGRVIEVGNREPAGKKHKCLFVVECSSKPEYPNPVQVEAYGDDISEVAAALNEGDVVRIEAYIRGRFWDKGGKYFVSVAAHKIAVETKAAPRTDAPDANVDDTAF